MKKLLLIGTFIFTCLFASAQDGLKGTWFVGGALNIGSNKSYATGTEVKTDSYTIQPLLGTFVSPSVAVGGALGYSHTKIVDSKINTFTIMPLARKYWNVTGSLYFFGQAALPVEIGNTKLGDLKTNTLGVAVALAPGFDWIVTSWMTVETSFTLVSAGYTSSKPKGGDTSSSWSIGGNSINSTSFGELSVGVKFLF